MGEEITAKTEEVAVEKTGDMSDEEIKKNFETIYKEYKEDPHAIRNINIVLLSLLWTKCRRGNKQDFSEMLLKEKCTSYSKRALENICNGNIYTDFQLSKECADKITETLQIPSEYMSGERIFEINDNRNQEKRMLIRYYYCLLDKGSNLEINKEKRSFLLRHYAGRLLYTGIHSQEKRLKAKDPLQYDRMHYDETPADTKLASEHKVLLEDAVFCGLRAMYEKISVYGIVKNDLERAMYYIKYLENNNADNMGELIRASREQIRKTFDNLTFWKALDGVVADEGETNLDKKINGLEKWQKTWEEQLGLIKSKKCLLEAERERNRKRD